MANVNASHIRTLYVTQFSGVAGITFTCVGTNGIQTFSISTAVHSHTVNNVNVTQSASKARVTGAGE